MTLTILRATTDEAIWWLALVDEHHNDRIVARIDRATLEEIHATAGEELARTTPKGTKR